MEKKACCESKNEAPTVPRTKMDFLEEKLKNFRTFLGTHATTPELQKELTQFATVEEVLPFLAQLIPLYKAGQMDLIIKGFSDKFGTTDEAFKTKVGRYIECFCETMTS